VKLDFNLPLGVKGNQTLYEVSRVATLNRNGWQFSPGYPEYKPKA
jgi:hypothetical protein